MVYRDAIASGFYLLPGGCDGRLNHYFLEHSWLWLKGEPLHADFWDAPFFYPYKNVMAYSDTLLGVAPLYWLVRGLGFSEINSLLLMPGVIAILNWITMDLLLKRIFGIDNISSATGAFLFAFCAPRVFRLVHFQLWLQFYTILTIYFIALFYIYTKSNSGRAWVCLLAAGSCAVLQFYAAYYLGWFLVFGACIYFMFLMLCKPTRSLLMGLAMKQWIWLLVSFAFCCALIAPLLNHYIDAQKFLGMRTWAELGDFLPELKSWIATPSLLYQKAGLNAVRNAEHLNGIGIVTAGISIYGLIRYSRKSLWIRCLLLASMVIIALATAKGDNSHPWQAVYAFFPGGAAIRAVSRIFFLLLIPIALGYSFAMSRQRLAIKLLLIAILLAENTSWGVMANNRDQYQYSRALGEKALASDLPFLYISDEDCGVFDKNLDAMWAALYARRKTINGYSGNFPTREQYEAAAVPLSRIRESGLPDLMRTPFLLIIRKGEEFRMMRVNPGLIPQP